MFGRGNNQIVARNFRCTGVEEQLLDCSHSTIPLSHGPFYQYLTTAGVICQGDTSKPTECEHGNVRLVDGQIKTEGRVEVCAYGYWATVCDNSQFWSTNQAKLICTQLDFPMYRKQHVYYVLHVSLYGIDQLMYRPHPIHSGTEYIPGSQFGSNYQLPIVELSCGTEVTNIGECQIHTQTGANCNHRTNMGVVCGGELYFLEWFLEW